MQTRARSGADQDVRGQLRHTNDEADDDFDAADPAGEWAEFTAATENVQDITNEDDGEGRQRLPAAPRSEAWATR